MAEPVIDYAHSLGEFIASTGYSDFPPHLVEKAKRHFLDTLGAMLAGTDSDIWHQCAALAREEGGHAQSLLVGQAWRVTPRQSAWLNGVAAHMYELDDTGGCDHSGAVVMPAILAALPLVGNVVDGQRLLTAFIIGYDIGRRVLEACGGYNAHNEAGWHSTATCGVFGATAAVCNLLRLPPAQCSAALGIAGSFSSGLWAFIHDGSQTKKLHAGRAAESGLFAAQLAQRGIQGPGAIFAEKWGGFLQTIAPHSQLPEALVASLGQVWKLARCSIKPYASCRGTHSAVDALNQLLSVQPLAQVQRIHVRLNPFLMEMCGGRSTDSLAAAQMSLPYALAARLCYGSAGLESYSEEKRLSPQVSDMMARIILEVDASQQGDEEPVVILHTTSGRVAQVQVPVPSGSPGNPLSDEALLAKFHQLASRVLPEALCRELEQICLHLDGYPDTAALLNILSREEAQTRDEAAR
ncbi:MmgE/PrpD family protein [Mangrovibacter plantisponsor]|uniref:2-methylcitrate dehydratase PrpD n=1 Tax=Mangrovibacter plantisponsor TaxID=451513 RepID=A0A317Q8L3_9ENTR|nr:MmgE/PrpD family protein [Mangrovibacter plantisponsor]PWW12931.1 2-methylcitrate dehydratase PrpD [Mangrovibacter plantisponsor]